MYVVRSIVILILILAMVFAYSPGMREEMSQSWELRVLSKKRGGAQAGHIAPVSSGELKTHGMAYKIYSLLFPIAWAVSKLDRLFPASTNNAVIVTAIKLEQQ